MDDQALTAFLTVATEEPSESFLTELSRQLDEIRDEPRARPENAVEHEISLNAATRSSQRWPRRVPILAAVALIAAGVIVAVEQRTPRTHLVTGPNQTLPSPTPTSGTATPPVSTTLGQPADALGSWVQLAGGPSPRAGATVLWLGSRLAVLGGEAIANADGGLYDPRTGGWSPIPASPAGGGAVESVWTGAAVVQVRTHEEVAAAFDLQNSQWRTLPSPPPRPKPSQPFEGLYFAGGRVVDAGRGAEFDPTAEIWRPWATPPAGGTTTDVPLRGSVFGEKIYFTGFGSNVWIYDPAASSWSIGPMPPAATIDRGTRTATSTGVALGNSDGVVALFDASTRTWSQLASPGVANVPACNSQLTTLGGALVLFRCDELLLAAGTGWTRLATPPPSPLGCCLSQVATTGSELYDWTSDGDTVHNPGAPASDFRAFHLSSSAAGRTTTAAEVDGLVAQHPEWTVHSKPTPGVPSFVLAGVATDGADRMELYEFTDAGWTVTWTQEFRDFTFDTSRAEPILIGDVTGDGVSDFVVYSPFASGTPLVVVSNDGGQWRTVLAANGAPPTNRFIPPSAEGTLSGLGNGGDIYLGAYPVGIVDGHIVSGVPTQSDYDDKRHSVTWRWDYDRANRYFVAARVLATTTDGKDDPVPTPAVAPLDYRTPPPFARIKSLMTLKVPSDPSGRLPAMTIDDDRRQVIVVDPAKRSLVIRDTLNGTTREVPLHTDSIPIDLTTGPNSLVYALLPEAQGVDPAHVQLAAIPIDGDNAGHVVATAVVDGNLVSEAPVAFLGRGPDGVIDRRFNTQLMPWVPSPYVNFTWYIAASQYTVDGQHVVLGENAMDWALSITRHPTNPETNGPRSPVLPGAADTAIYQTTIGPVADPTSVDPNGTVPVIGLLHLNGAVIWERLPDGWQVTASDVSGTVLSRRVGNTVEIATLVP